jgi:hypothetical protein
VTLRTGIWLAAVASALALAGCGGGADPEPAPPALPRALAQDLAAQAEQIAATFAAGDVCGAAGQADELKDAATAAVDAGRVPAAMRQELLATVEVLVNEINCPPPEPPPAEEEDECEELEREKKALDEQIKEAEEEEKQALEEQKKALEEQIKACKEEREDDD